MKRAAIVLAALLILAPLAYAQQTYNITTSDDCVKALDKAQKDMNALKRIYILFSILFSLLLMTIAFSTIYIIRARQRLRRLEEIEVYEEIKKEEKKERHPRKTAVKAVEKKGFFSFLGAMTKRTPTKKAPARKPAARRGPAKKTMFNGTFSRGFAAGKRIVSKKKGRGNWFA